MINVWHAVFLVLFAPTVLVEAGLAAGSISATRANSGYEEAATKISITNSAWNKTPVNGSCQELSEVSIKVVGQAAETCAPEDVLSLGSTNWASGKANCVTDDTNCIKACFHKDEQGGNNYDTPTKPFKPLEVNFKEDGLSSGNKVYCVLIKAVDDSTATWEFETAGDVGTHLEDPLGVHTDGTFVMYQIGFSVFTMHTQYYKTDEYFTGGITLSQEDTSLVKEAWSSTAGTLAGGAGTGHRSEDNNGGFVETQEQVESGLSASFSPDGSVYTQQGKLVVSGGSSPRFGMVSLLAKCGQRKSDNTKEWLHSRSLYFYTSNSGKNGGDCPKDLECHWTLPLACFMGYRTANGEALSVSYYATGSVSAPANKDGKYHKTDEGDPVEDDTKRQSEWTSRRLGSGAVGQLTDQGSQHTNSQMLRRMDAVGGVDGMDVAPVGDGDPDDAPSQAVEFKKSVPLQIVYKPAPAEEVEEETDAASIALVVGLAIMGVGVVSFGVAQVVVHVVRAKAIVAAHEAKVAADVVVSVPKSTDAPGNVALQLR